MTQSAFVPARSASSAASSTCSPATQITARSISSGIVRDRRGSACTPGDRLALEVDGIGDAAEAALEDVAEELAADRAAPRRGADDRDRARREERRAARRRPRRGRARRRARRYVPGRRDVETHLDLSALDLRGRGEAGVLEDAQHRAVPGHHLGDERARCPRARRDAASCSSSRVPTPWPWSSSATANATSADVGSRRRT